ncbi:MAG TPA: CoA transferase [Thermodesulforhabdus norvegica]|uniref:CoA transferase n=1 Tax=Thermodesulforhabdus norvegica TaxID=39841 RepID=A0A7C1B0T7_9BACT|nr:CoA transferase [Thermodesulforhabdus norvegica]
MLPLEGIRVLDLSRLLPGPFCSMLLADFGAEVIKIEDPKKGDYIRWWPPLLGGTSGFHIVLNRNKKSVTINLKSDEGKKIFLELVKKADVVLEGFRPGAMDKLGIGYRVLKEVNPKLIYCAITGYGQHGKRALRAGHDINYLAVAGILSYTGTEEGAPVVPGVQIADIGGGGLPAAFAIVLALWNREKTGKGDFLDISMTDMAVMWNCLRWGKFLADGKVPRYGDDMLNHGYACYSIYRTKDGRYMSLGALEPQFWENFCRALGREDLNVPEYFTPGEHQKRLKKELEEIFITKTQSEWIEFFAHVDCCCEPIRNLDEVMNDNEFLTRGLVVKMLHESWGAYMQLGNAIRSTQMQPLIRSHAPELGEHTEVILEEILNLTTEDIKKLRDGGII